MKLLPILAGIVLCAALAGCATNGGLALPVVTAPRLDPPDAAVTQDCPKPVALPAGDMTQQDIERFWRVDRRNLKACGAEKSVLVDYISARDGGLSGGGK